MTGYSSFARYYDALTKNVGYASRAKFFDDIIKKYGNNTQLVLDLACGTGSLCAELLSLGYDVIGADASAEMLAQATQKCGGRILLLNQQMGGLDLYGTVDAAICALDSINHLPCENEVLKTFKNVSLFMNEGGLFIFDVNTEFKHREILGSNSFVYDMPEVFCSWQNALCPKTLRVDITLDFFAPDGKGIYIRERECFSEWYYSGDFLKEALSQSGFSHIDTILFDKSKRLDETAQRHVYVAKKR